MMKVGSKRRRTKIQVKLDNEEAIRKEEEQAAALGELAALRARIIGLEQQAVNGKAAASLISQMINAGHIKQDSESTIVLNAANGEQRFDAAAPDDGNGQ